MKIKILLLCGFVIAIFACKSDKVKDKTDPTNITVPSNSDATNPSLADTTSSKKDSSVKKDTLRR